MANLIDLATTGFATGTGVIFAQKFISWLESHPITRNVKEILNGKPPKRNS